MIYNPLNWYWLRDDGVIFSSAVQDIIAADDPQHLEWLDAGGITTRWLVDIAGVQTDAAVNDVLRPCGIHISMSAAKAQAVVRINEAAEQCRGKYMTPGDGQMMTYLEKINQARACLAAQSPQASDYPMLAAEIGITASTLVGVAEIVAAAYNQWLVIGSTIEATRRAANVAIEAAETREAVQAILDGFAFPEGAPA